MRKEGLIKDDVDIGKDNNLKEIVGNLVNDSNVKEIVNKQNNSKFKFTNFSLVY